MVSIVLFGDYLTTLGAAWCLREYPLYLIRANGEESLVRHSRFVRQSVTVNLPTWDEVVPSLESWRKQHGNLIFLPCSDRWINVLSENLDSVLQLGTMLPVEQRMLALTLDKVYFYETLAQLRLPVPEIYAVNPTASWQPTSFPFVLKPASTFHLENSVGVKAIVCNSTTDWHAVDYRLLKQQAFVAQELVTGRSLSACFCTDAQGRLVSAYTTEKIAFLPMRAGARVRTLDAPELIALTQQFVTRTGFVGFGELEFIASARGPLLLELNARPWAQVLLSDYIGQPILPHAVKLMTGQAAKGQLAETPPPFEYLLWDRDLLVRRSLRKQGRACPPLTRVPRIQALSLRRDFWPAINYYLRDSRLGPGRFLKRQ